MIYVCTDIKMITPADKSRLFSFLSEEEAFRIKNRHGDQMEALVSYALLFLESGCTNISRDFFGKPFFPNTPDVHFSISHTKGAIAVALSSLPVGIDIESEGRSISSKVLQRICSEEEYLGYKDAPSKERITLWTLKEAYGKYKGKGISLPLSSVSFPTLSECSDPSVYFQSETQDGFVCSICSEKKEHFLSVTLAEILAKLPS